LTQSRQAVQENFEIAQDLSLLRHSLNDELSDLTNELVTMNYQEDRKPSLLEDLESLHRNLTELTSIKQYVQVIQRALQLRCATYLPKDMLLIWSPI
jgi:hypothetical protein